MAARRNREIRGGARDALGAWLARVAGSLSRALGAGAGTSLPGKILLKVAPGFIAHRAAELEGIVAISGTNGKTTTASMLRCILAGQGIEAVSNEAGANLASGVATALASADRKARLGVFEIDEAALARLAPAISPDVLVLTNVFRDQLDRFGEAETVLKLLRSAAESLEPGASLIANADDPHLWNAVSHRSPVGFGVAGLREQAGGRSDSEPETCPSCGGPLEITGRTIGHLGRGACPACGWASNPPDLLARIVEAEGLDSMLIEAGSQRISLAAGGTHNAYNAAAALAAALALGIPLEDSARALSGYRPRFGRSEQMQAGGRPLRLILIKNPAGAGIVIDEIVAASSIGAAVVAVSDRIADGRDISWIWDAPFEELAGTGMPLVPSGTRAHDVAVRLKYAGAQPLAAEPDPITAISAAQAASPEGTSTVALATYTAMLDIRQAVLNSRRGRLLDEP